MPGRRRRQRPEGRAAWGSLSRDQVVEAAMRVVDRGESERMTIRSPASDLGFAPMALYRHVRDKDDLLEEVLDRLLQPVWEPKVRRGLWQACVAESADRLRALLVTQPVALRVYLRHPVTCPAGLARMEAMLEVLYVAGLDDQRAESAYAAIQNYTVGFAALEASRDRWRSPEDHRDPVAQRLADYTIARTAPG